MKTKFLGKANNKSKKKGKNLIDNIHRTKGYIKYVFDKWNVNYYMEFNKNMIHH